MGKAQRDRNRKKNSEAFIISFTVFFFFFFHSFAVRLRDSPFVSGLRKVDNF